MPAIHRLRDIVARLRAPDGCPWDREQTHASLRGALIEECYEVIEAIERADDANLKEELGDLLLHVVMHAQMARERSAFTLEEVAADICEKMIRRHPHVFGDKPADDSAAVLRQWERIKREEKKPSGVLDGLPASMPALLRAQNAQKKAGRVGFDWPDVEPVFEKMQEEISEVRDALSAGDAKAVEEEVGDILFTAVNLARKLHVDAETSLASATNRFIRRFQAVEAELGDRKMQETPLAELDEIWNRIKRA
ncbi:MAG: nucleoside triphosphate pyrophosphohydrolase [Verrucomicrobiae bacterium]